MQALLNFFNSISSEILSTVVLGTILLVAVHVLGWIRIKDVATEDQRFWKLTFRNIATVIFILGMLFIWRDGFQTIFLALGAAAAGFLIAFKEAWLSFLGFWTRLIRRPYDINDFISIDGIQGRVLDITWFNTVIAETSPTDSLEYTGRVVHIPNNRILLSELITENLTGRFSAHIFQVTLPKGTTYKQALHYEQILATCTNKHCSTYFEMAEAHMLRLRRKKSMYTPHVKPRIRFVFEPSGMIVLHVRIVVPMLEKSRVEQVIVREFLKLSAKQIDAPADAD